jgi:hypothetical protein
LGKRWRGPFEIMAKVDPVTYRVKQERSRTIKIFPVHVQRMKRYVQFHDRERGKYEVNNNKKKENKEKVLIMNSKVYLLNQIQFICFVALEVGD